jgi:hypothetical protein
MQSANEGFDAVASTQSSPSEKDAANQSVQLATQQASTAFAKKGGGPRTKRGKQKSSHNAIKQGIFSRVVLLRGESRAEYKSLLEGFRADRKPQGELEDQLVDELVMNRWRKRRVIIAEGAEIRKATEFLRWDEMHRQHDETLDLLRVALESRSLIHRITKPEILTKCLSMLKKLEQSIDENGFDEENDRVILDRLYEDSDPDTLEGTIKDSHSHWLNLARSHASGGDQNELTSPEQCKNNFLKDLKHETRRLKAYRSEQALTESRKMEVEALRGNVPDSPQLERSLRYETTLDRAFDRTLNQLERIQRARKGQPSSPTSNVNAST